MTEEPLKIPMWKCKLCGYKSFGRIGRRVYSTNSGPATTREEYDNIVGKMLTKGALK